MSDFSKPFYSIDEVAELLGVSRSTIKNLLRAGKLEHYRVGKQYRISAAELERLKVPAENRDNDKDREV